MFTAMLVQHYRPKFQQTLQIYFKKKWVILKVTAKGDYFKTKQSFVAYNFRKKK